MPQRFLIDENLRGPLWSAIRRHNQLGLNVLDVERVGDPQDLPLGSQDPLILKWAERENRILVSLDKSTLATHLISHLSAGGRCPGIFALRSGARITSIVESLILVAYASEAAEWENQITYIR